MKLGYARVSTADQNLDLQLDALRAAGAEKVYKDRISGMKAARPSFDSLMEHARAGDVVVVWRLDRLARSTVHLIELMQTFEKREIGFVSLTENIDTTTAGGRLMFHIFAALAEFERNLIVERTNAGLAAAKAKGIHGGRRRVLDATKQNVIDKMLKEAREQKVRPNFGEIARALGVSPRTARRYADGEY